MTAARAVSLVSLWRGWKRFAHTVGDVQARILLTVIYGLVVSAFAMPYRLVADPLNRHPRGTSFWIARPAAEATLVEARQQ